MPVEEKLAKAISSAIIADVANPKVQKAIDDLILLHDDPKEALARIVLRDIYRGMRGERGPALFPSLRKLVKTQALINRLHIRADSLLTAEEALVPEGEMGQIDWGEIVGAVVT